MSIQYINDLADSSVRVRKWALKIIACCVGLVVLFAVILLINAWRANHVEVVFKAIFDSGEVVDLQKVEVPAGRLVTKKDLK